ncbi:uncharacterized protein LOC103874181 [Brassica rapa]|uniref:uncharacterized protein LOC103874181 n=1 Tax=Brassica campestris TaxID=3711 RepID=UPI0004F16528|nr:uncharacterized protein LOC103874181 [Brassica rapa]
MTIRREKQLLQLQEKAMIEERMKVRQEERLAVLKMEEEEEARSNDLRDDEHFFIDHPVAVHIRLLPVLRTGQALEEPSFILFTANAQKQGYVSNDSNKALRFMFAYS